MKILHTSDWHLGQKFLHFDRREETAGALAWLVECIREEEVDVLLVAGDVFDMGSPPNYAEEQYYNFLAALQDTPCQHVVITAGNHDSPAHLQAPESLLKVHNVHVRTKAGSDELILLKDKKGKPQALVAAVPFLRDRDLGANKAGESPDERRQRLRDRIRTHYLQLAEQARKLNLENVPHLAMGHLYAMGAKASDPERQKNIYLGDEKNIAASDFPALFGYVALGHIHRAQAVDTEGRVRYSGSLIPLSFRETIDNKSVTLTRWEKNKLVELRELPLPLFRRLKTIKGHSPGELLEKMRAFAKRHQSDPLKPWLDLQLENDYLDPGLRNQLQEEAQNLPVELLQLRLKKQQLNWQDDTTAPSLDTLSPQKVFAERCKQAHLPKGQMKKLQATFDELLEWMQQNNEST